jgi:hypothetical protein
MKTNTYNEAVAIVAFLTFADNVKPATLIGEREIELISAAAARLRRQIEAASKAGSARSRKKSRAARDNGKRGGRPSQE